MDHFRFTNENEIIIIKFETQGMNKRMWLYRQGQLITLDLNPDYRYCHIGCGIRIPYNKKSLLLDRTLLSQPLQSPCPSKSKK
jgi:hypothetical protein